MLVNDCMMRHPILIPPTTPAAEAERIMTDNKIRHLPVVGDGKRLMGLVTRQQLALKPTDIGSLDVWEITRILSNLKVADVMVKANDVFTITSDRTIERAASILTEHKIGCLPVVEDEIVIGILTEADLLRAFQEMLGLPAVGVRVTMRMPDRTGEFIKLASVMAERGWGVMGIGSFPSHRNPGFYDVVVKIPRVSVDEVIEALSQVPGQTIADIREGV
ncbi:MAG: CBS domain-containing protein [Anaerolineales bacterium]|nr:CBS domain-containing protein [Anaerolineales bacterium]